MAERLGVCDRVRSRYHAQLAVQLADVGVTVFGEMESGAPLSRRETCALISARTAAPQSPG